MPSIDELLNNLGTDVSDQAEKTASDNTAESDVESQAKELGLIGDEVVQTKTASISNDGGSNMDLNDYYNNIFSEEVEKTASAHEVEQEQEMSKEAQGEMAGAAFAEELETRLLAHSVKLAADMAAPDSEATKDIQSGAGVIPGAQTANPQLPVQKNRHGESDDTAIDTSPQHYDLKGMDGAVAKAKLEAALDKGNLSEVSYQTVNVESEMQEGGSQKEASVSMRDLTKEQIELLNTEFPEEMMKEAYAQVAEEQEKVAELHQTASDCYNFGAELAMQKIAEMEAKAKEEEKEEEKSEEDKEEEKTASAMGKFITEGYWDTLMEKGAEFYGDENIYIEELIKEAKGGQVMNYLKSLGKSLKGKAKGAKKAVSKDLSKVKREGKKLLTGKGPQGGNAKRMTAAKNLAGTGTAKAVGGAAALGGAYGLGKASKD